MGHEPEIGNEDVVSVKICTHCQQAKPLGEFLRRTGKRSGKHSRRGACKACRQARKAGALPALPAEPEAVAAAEAPAPLPPERRPVRGGSRPPLPAPPPRPAGPDASVLRPTRSGVVWMRGRTDKGRRWYQETDLATAVNLVQEHAAVVVNRHTIRRLYSNKQFREYILTRDNNTCYFCGEYGDTIDHLVPRAKGGHTTPVNCVCACTLCNQYKADKDLDEFIDS